MLIIPAIDIKDGKCVRLRQGDMSRETIFSSKPSEVAKKWRDQGARRLHIVDLDGAFKGEPSNKSVIRKIAKECPDLSIQVGGGIRDEDTIKAYLGEGIAYVILGTKAVTSPKFVESVCSDFPTNIFVGLDVKEDRVAIDGWSNFSNIKAPDLAKEFEAIGVGAIIFTDISRDGMLSGSNVTATSRFAEGTTLPVIASGGVTNLDDIKNLCSVSSHGIEGVIVGRSIYEGTLNLREAQVFADKYTGRN